MKRVAVTGSLGYVGSVLVPYLLSRGYEVMGFDTGFFKDALLYPPSPYHTSIKDMRDISTEDLRGFDAVVHLAAMSNDPFGNLDERTVYGVARDYTRTIATRAKEMGMNFIFASSCSVYGAGVDSFIDEQGPTMPLTSYSRNKLETEKDLGTLADETFSPVALRFATAYGLSPRMRFDIVINMLIGMAVGTRRVVLNSDGTAWRPFIHIEDMAQTVVCALESQSSGGLRILNAGTTSENFQIRDIAEQVAEALPGTSVEFLSKTRDSLGEDMAELVHDRKVEGDADKRTYQVSFENIRQVFPNFTPTHTVKETIPQMIAALTEMKFSQRDFKNRGFYRLQRMEDLFKTATLDENLYWREPQPHVYP